MKHYLTLPLLLFSFLVYGQANFKWEKIDSVNKTKSQIYSDTKMFIAETWKSAQAVIQNDDKEAGQILIKGISIHNVTSGMGVGTQWNYSYTVKFYMKDGKVKIVIDNVVCDNALWGGRTGTIRCGDICDSCEFPGFGATGLSKSKYDDMLISLKAELQSVVDGYLEFIKKQSTSSSDW